MGYVFVATLMTSGPTGCRLAAASAGNACQNAHDLAREAVGWMRVLAGLRRYYLQSGVQRFESNRALIIPLLAVILIAA